MNLLSFLDLAYKPRQNLKLYSPQGQNLKIFLIFTYNQGKVFLILPITLGRGTCIPGLHWKFFLFIKNKIRTYNLQEQFTNYLQIHFYMVLIIIEVLFEGCFSEVPKLFN